MKLSIRTAVVVLACLATGFAVIGRAQPTDQATGPASAEIKALLDRFAHSTDMLDRSEIESRRRLIAKGTTVVPVLEQLFKESTDDQYRTSIVSVLFAIRGAERDAVRIVVEGLSKEPAAWHGSTWVFTALLRLPDVDPEKARWVSRRLLETQSRSLQLTALGHLEKLGKPEDLDALKRFLASRQQYPAPDGPAISAEKAIDAITKRQETDATIKAAKNGKQQAEPNPVVKSNASRDHMKTPDMEAPSGFYSSKWLWVTAGLLVVIVIVLWIGSRFR